MIKKINGLWFVYSKDGKKRLSKGYKTRAEAVRRLQQIEFFKHKSDKMGNIRFDSAAIDNLEYEMNDDNLILYNVPIVAEIVQKYEDGMAYKPLEVIKDIEVDNVPLTMVDDKPKHPNKHLSNMDTKGRAGVVVGFMTEPSRPKPGQDQNPKRYADYVIHRIPKTKALEDAIKSGKTIDTSIGFTFDQLDHKGEFNNQEYDYIQTDIQLDHNHILIDAQGRMGRGRAPYPIAGIGADANDQRQPTTTQTLILSKDVFKSLSAARAWIKEHNFKSGKVDETENSYRFKQIEKDKFKDGSFRTITLRNGVKAVIGKLKKQDMEGNNMTDEKLQARVDELEKENGELKEENKETKEKLEESEKKVEESEKKVEEATKATEEAEKKTEEAEKETEEAKKEDSGLKKELDEYKEERKARVDSAKEYLLGKYPDMKPMIDATDDKMLLKQYDELKETEEKDTRHVGADMMGPKGKDSLKDNDKSFENYSKTITEKREGK